MRMFFVLPYSHDRTLFDVPWVAIGLIVVNFALMALTAAPRHAIEHEMSVALVEAVDIDRHWPETTVSQQTYDRLPSHVVSGLALQRPDEASEPVDAPSRQLDAVLARYADQRERHPTVRWGYDSESPSLVAAFTSMFTHVGWMHCLGNLLFLWLTGTVIESFWRRGPFVALYVVGGLWSALWWDLLGGDGVLVGASGAIAALMGAFMIGHPYTRVRFVYFFWAIIGRPANGTFEAPAWSALAIWGALQLWGLVRGGGSVAFGAHLAGFVLGAAVAWVMKSNRWIREDDDHIDPDKSEHLVEWTKQLRGQYR